MEEFLIYKFNENGQKRYLESIYQNSVSTDPKITDAIRFNDKTIALAIRDYLRAREDVEFKVLKVETKTEDIEE